MRPWKPACLAPRACALGQQPRRRPISTTNPQPTTTNYPGPERHARPLCVAGTLAVVAGLYFGGVAGWLAAFAGVALLLAACYSRADGFLLLGPFARIDGVRVARHRRTHWLRAATALGAGAVIYFNSQAFQPYYYRTYYTQVQQVRFQNEQIVNWFAVAVGLMVPALTVMVVSGVIAEERAGKRWDVLLTTDLRAREIVFGKLLGKLWTVVEPVVVIAPVLTILPLIVGLSVEVMLLYGCAVFLSMLALAGLAAFFSAGRRRQTGAAGGVVAVALGYLAASAGLTGLTAWPSWWTFPRSEGVDSPVVVADLVEFANAANPFTTAMFVLKRGAGLSPLAAYAEAVQQFAAGALGVFLLGTLLACRRVRTGKELSLVAVPRRSFTLFGPRQERESRQVRRAKSRPPVTDEPLAWWANCQAGGFTVGHISRRLALRLFARCVLLLSAVYGVDLVGQLTVYPAMNAAGYRLSDWEASRLVRTILTIALPAAMLLPVFVPVFVAAASIAKERSGDTLDSLRLTPLSAAEMMRQIRAGCLQINAFGVGLWAIPAAAAFVTGYIFPPPAQLRTPRDAAWAVFVVAVALVTYAAVALIVVRPLVAFALYCSAWASTPARAVRNLLFGGVIGHYVLMFLVLGFLALLDGTAFVFGVRGIVREWEQAFIRFSEGWPREARFAVVISVAAAIYGAGLGLYVLLGRGVYRLAVGRFARSRRATD